MKPHRFAILSHILPPSPSGQSVMLYRILSDINPDDYYLISREEYKKSGQKDSTFFLPCEYHHLSPPKYLYRLNRIRFWHFHDFVNIFLPLFSRTIKLSKLIRQRPVEALITCSGDIVDMPAGFLAAKITHTPFLGYIFDDYVYQWTGIYRIFARVFASIIFKNSQGIIGPNEFICDEYQRRYGVASAIVRNPCNPDEFDTPVFPSWPAEDNKIKIVYTGAIYHANFDCFRNLIGAMKLLKSKNPELHIFTSQSVDQVGSQGITGEDVHVHSHVAYDEILKEQRKADILFLPLGFDTPIPEVIRTSAPGKMGEYLFTGRPVLAHVPDDSFVAYYLRKYACGMVVSENDPGKLARGIEELSLNTEYRDKITHNSRMQAKADLTPELACVSLMNFLDTKVIGRNHGY